MPGFASIIPAPLWAPEKKDQVIEFLRKLMFSDDSAPDAKALFSAWAKFLNVPTTSHDFQLLEKSEPGTDVP